MEQCSKRLILQKQRQRVKKVNIIQGVKLIIFSKGHLAPKFFKVVAHSKKVGRHFQRQTRPFLRCQRSRETLQN